MRLSFVVPMFNASSSIEKCLVSTQKQDIPASDYEVVVINDGSTDDSLVVAKKVSTCYQNIHIYSQSNSGLSIARNAALDRAKGNYIFFLDSDDWISENCLNKIVTACEKNNLDMLRICAANVINDVPIRRFSLEDGKIVTGKEMLKGNVPACAPFSVYSRDFLNRHNLRFYPGIFHEDNEFTPRAFYLAERVSALNDIIYYVNQTQGSITRSVNVKKPLDLTIVMKNLDYFSHKYIKKSDAPLFHRIIAGAMNSALQQTFSLSRKEREIVNNAFYEIRYLFVHARRSPSWKYRLAGWIYTLFPHHVVQVYHALHFKF